LANPGTSDATEKLRKVRAVRFGLGDVTHVVVETYRRMCGELPENQFGLACWVGVAVQRSRQLAARQPATQ